MRRIYEERHAALCDAASRELDGLLDIVRADSGLHTIGHLPCNVPEVEAARAAEARRIIVSPIARFSIAPTGANGLVLGFGSIRPPEIRSGIAILGKALRDLMQDRRVTAMQ